MSISTNPIRRVKNVFLIDAEHAEIKRRVELPDNYED
jgi:hypothetical protein